MFISRHTLKWTKTCRSSGDFPHAHTAHFLLNRHRPRAIRRRTCRDVGATAPTRARPRPRPATSPTATSPPSPRTRSGPRTSPGISRPGTGRACLSPPVDCHDGGIVACTAGSGPDAGLADGMLVKAAETLPEGEAKPLVHSDRGLPTAGAPDGRTSWNGTA